MLPWLAQECASERARTLLIGGDLTDAKDYHSAKLTNRIVEAIANLSYAGLDVVILMGNHDYLLKGHSYFSFLSRLQNVRFITEPTALMDDDGPTAFCLPHSKNPSKEWAGMDFSHFDFLFMHQTVRGAIASNGQEMDGDPLPPLNAGKVFSGDIHVPQIIGDVEYIGSPYHVHFGDRFKPRCILIDKRMQRHDLHYETINRVAMTIQGEPVDADFADLRRGDHVKLKIALDPSEGHEWRRIKREAWDKLTKRGAEVFGIQMVASGNASRLAWARPTDDRPTLTDPEVLERFVLREGLGGEALEVGLRILE